MPMQVGNLADALQQHHAHACRLHFALGANWEGAMVNRAERKFGARLGWCHDTQRSWRIEKKTKPNHEVVRQVLNRQRFGCSGRQRVASCAESQANCGEVLGFGTSLAK